MKYDFIVRPGADISQIRIRYEGADNLAITPNGDLEAATLFGPIHENIPSIYQEIGGGKREVTGSYIIREPGVFGFEVEDYDPSLTLVIDPVVLAYSTYVGGSGWDGGYGIAVDGSGSAYVIGYTESTDFPTENPYQTDQAGPDVFVTKFSPAGNSLVYSTYLGGDGWDVGLSIAVDGGGSAYVTGYTMSTDFPTENPFQTDQGDRDVFVTKLSSAGNSLIYSTYLGGNSLDEGYGIAVDGNGHAYVTGRTLSTNFPTENPYQTYQNAWDVFVTKFSQAGDSLAYSTYLGGSIMEKATGIVVDGSGSAYITGLTVSADFPTLNYYQMDLGDDDYDAFVTKFSPGGNSLIYSTYLGGNEYDEGNGIAVDGSGSAYVTGYTWSTDFPTENPYQMDQAARDAFVTKLSPAGNSLLYSTYLGGNVGGDGWDVGYGIAVDGSGNAYVTGYTLSTDFPTLNYYQTDLNTMDAFVTKFGAVSWQWLRGRKFNDLDGNCVQGPGEVGLPGWTIIANPGGNARITDSNGDYAFYDLATGSYTISEVLKPNWEQTCPLSPGTHTVQLNTGDLISNLDFGNRPLSNIQDLKIDVGGTRARPGFLKTYIINYENIGTVSVPATVVTLALPSEVDHVLSSSGGVYYSGPHNVVWQVGALTPGQTGSLWTKVSVQTAVPIGTAITSTARIDPETGDQNPADNTDSETQIVRASFDPNEKHVTPEGDIGATDLLTYHIDFQNVGNDTAFTVVVVDTLDPNLEMATMACGASSHSYDFDIIGRELTWTFANINLPDSIIDEPGSHGFVEFSVLPVDGVLIGTVIENWASIYFDFNDPVVTNTVSNTIVSQNIPTLSEWGMLILGLLLLAVGTVAVVRRKRAIEL